MPLLADCVYLTTCDDQWRQNLPSASVAFDNCGALSVARLCLEPTCQIAFRNQHMLTTALSKDETRLIHVVDVVG